MNINHGLAMRKGTILETMGRSHALEILAAISKKSMRFTELKGACESNRTRSARLRELEDGGLIRTVPKMIGRRAYTFYEITPMGREALTLCEKLLRLGLK